MESERRGPSRRRFQAAVRVGTKIGYAGVFRTKEERDRAVRVAKEAIASGRDPKFISEWDGSSDREEFDDPWQIPSRHPTGEQRLCAAILLQAARDLQADEGHVRGGARRWVLSESGGFGSLRFCCDTLGIEVQWCRDRMLRLESQGERRTGGSEWQREPSAPLTLVRKDTARS